MFGGVKKPALKKKLTNVQSGPSSKTKSNKAGPKFTFREVKALKQNATKNVSEKSSGDTAQKKNTGNYTEELRRLLIKLDVSEDERKSYISLCKISNIGKQEFNKTSLRILFGENKEPNNDQEIFEDNDENKTLFLRNIDTNTAGRGAKKQTTNALGSKHMYFITVLVSASHSCFANTSVSKIRSSDVVCLCLPPENATSQHGTKLVDQDRLADLMLMKIYFVVRYIYRTLKKEIEKDISTSTNSERQQHRFPAIIIRHAPQTNNASPSWFRLLKEKFFKGENTYAKCLSLDYPCNIL